MKKCLHPLTSILLSVWFIASFHPATANPDKESNPDDSHATGMVAENLVLNGEFDTGTSNWSLTDFTAPSGSSISVVQGAGMSGNNALLVDVVNTDNSGWKLQVEQVLNFRLEVGRTYRVKFMAKAESNRNIFASLFGNGSNVNYYYSHVPFSLNTSTQNFTFEYHCTDPDVDTEPNFSLKFYLADGVISDVWLDQFSIEDITDMVTDVAVAPAFVVLNEAETWQLTKAITPSNAANQNVAWSSDNTAAAHVSSTGLVTAVGPGSATITATTLDGGLTATTVVNVPAAGTTPVLNNEFDSGTSGWLLDDVTGGPGVSSISTVSGSGLSGANALRVDIVNDDDTYWKVEVKNTVPFRFELGRTYRISFMGKAESAREINVSLWGNGSNSDYYITTSNLTTSSQTLTFDFTFNNPNVNTEPSFAIKFYLAKGVISDVWLDNLTVQDMTDIVTGVTVSPDFVALNQGQTWQLSKTITPSTATNQNVNWSTSNSNVATVNSTGLVTAASPGTATITATTADGGLTATAVINVPAFGTTTVQNGELDSGADGWFLYDYTAYPSTAGISVVTNAGLSGTNALRVDVVNTDNSTWMLQLFKMLDFRFEVGKTYRISFMGKAESERGIDLGVWGNAGNVNYSYHNLSLSTSPQTLTVDFTITDTEVNNEPSFGIKFYMAKGVISDIWLDNLTVQDITSVVNVTGVGVSPSILNLNIGDEAQITKSIAPANASNQIVNWTSGDPSIAAVNAAGLVQAVSAGTTTITATTADGAFTASATVDVASETETTRFTVLEQFAFKYKYDERKRMTQKKVPGAAWVYMVYDNRDRLVMTQDGEQRKTKKWTFTKYDQLNRPVLTGIYTDPETVPRDQDDMQTAINTFYVTADEANHPDEWFEVTEGPVHGYTNNSFPKVNSEIDYLTVTYYDNYSFQPLIGSSSDDFDYDASQLTALGNEVGQRAEEFSRVQGQVTGTKIKNLDTNEFLWSVNYYDDRYRVIQTIAENNREGLDKMTNVYDFVGKVLRTKTDHTTTGSTINAVATMRKFTYDHVGRLVQTDHATGTEDPVALVKNEYNELGQLVTKNLHSEDEISYKQQVDYRYNIRGWLTRINDSDLSAEDGGPTDYFGMELGYNDAIGISATAQYNGNISAMKWSTNLGFGFNDTQLEIFEPTARGYAFTYDPLNRLKTSGHFENTVDWNTATSFHENIEEYDLNGNIKKLKRTGKNGNNMDLLDYVYSGNRLMKVIDDGNDTEGFKDGNVTGDDYIYDLNGNMITDKNKGINTIEYNYLNLPARVIKKDGQYVRYIYNSAGVKMSQEVYDASHVLKKKTDYLGEFFYENDTLKFVNHEEGRVVMTGSEPEYQYTLKDHLGNTRITFTSVHAVDTFMATMDPENQQEEEQNFGAYNSYTDEPLDPTPAENVEDKILILNGSTLQGGNNGQVGLTKSFAVVPGDKVSASVNAKYITATSTSSNLADFASVLTEAFGLDPGLPGEAANAFQAINDFGTLIATGGRNDSDNEPKGFVTIIVFDKDHNFVDLSFQQIISPTESLSASIDIRQAGYAYVFLSNEGATVQQIGFDNYSVTHEHSDVIQQDDYYPFGLTFNSYQRENSTPQDYKYNSVELQDELNLQWYDYGARMYDPAIARWMVVDPLADMMRRHSPYNYAFDNPVRFIDPDGMGPNDVILKGEEAQKAFAQLQASVQGQMNLSMNSEGKVTYTKSGDGELEEGAQKLANAIDDHSAVVNVNASSSTTTPDGKPIIGGAWLGTKMTGETTADGTAVVEGNQQVNSDQAAKIDAHYGEPGSTILHEVTESYEGAKLTQITGQEYEGSIANPAEYKTVHINAVSTPVQPNDIKINFYDKSGTMIPANSWRVMDATKANAVLQAPGKSPVILNTFKPKFN